MKMKDWVEACDRKAVVLGTVFELFAKESPITVMMRGTMENALSAKALDTMFAETAKQQYTRDLLFSSLVNMMSLVVCGVRPAVHAAYQACKDELEVSVTAIYDKLSRVEPDVSAELVRHVVERVRPVIEATGGAMEPWLPGYQIRILDGNHLAATERRLKPLRGSVAGPLPGQCLVVLDPELMLAIDVIPCEDGHAQERSLTPKILDLVKPKDVWIDDRNFCTTRLLFGIEDRDAFFITRQHATNVKWRPAGKKLKRGSIDTGTVWEQEVLVWEDDPASRSLHLRRITVALDKKTRDGDREIHILTNLPAEVVTARRIAEWYRKRWTVETAFQEIQATLSGEINTLGYPKAALFAFCLALVAYNVLSVVKAALRAAHGHRRVQEEVSGYYIADEVRGTYRGMMIAIPEPRWEVFQSMTREQMAATLVVLAAKVRLAAFRKHPRGPKKPVPKRTRYKNKGHVSTARLMAGSRGRRRAP